MPASAGRGGRREGVRRISHLLREQETMKKTYTPPTLVKHGNTVAVTLGQGGQLLEFINFRPGH